MENLCSFVSSRGIVKSCDHHNKNPQSSSDHIDDDLLDGFKMGDSIYVCYEALPNFVKNFLPNIHHYFTLVTGDSDHNVTMYKEETDRILNHPHLINWYVQNRAIEHPKLQSMPIGLDFHTVWEKPGNFGMRQTSPLAQERMMLNALSQSPPPHKKFASYYCNWVLKMYADRPECYEKIDKDCCFFENLPAGRKFMFQRQAEFMFTVSPSGLSYECHRTWESIILGSVPIVKPSLTNFVYDGLPVMKVDDWAQVNKASIPARVKEISESIYDFNPLFLQYWMSKINRKKYMPIPKMTIMEFRELLTANYF